MNYLESKRIFEQNLLISRKNSKKIVGYLNNRLNMSDIDEEIFDIVDKQKIQNVKNEFEIFKSNFKDYKIINRNQILYEYIKSKNKKFNFEIKNGRIALNLPTIKSLRLSLSSIIFLNNEKFDQLNKIYSKYTQIIEKEKKSHLFLEIQQFFQNTKIKYPSNEIFKDFISLLIKCRKNSENISVISPVCPDYSHTTLKENFYSFTFEKLNEDIGLVAKNILNNTKNIKDFFSNIKCHYDQELLVGDFEAYEKKNLKKLNITREDFLNKIRLTQSKINSILKTQNSNSFLDICGGYTYWNKKKNYFQKKLNNFNFGNSNINKEKFNEILESRKKIYKNWYPNLTEEQQKEMLVSQGAEYAAMGYFISKKYKNPIVIGADHHVMSPFYRVENKNLVVLYIQKNYKT